MDLRTFEDELAMARDRVQWAGTPTETIRVIAEAHDAIVATSAANGRRDHEASHRRWAACARLEMARRDDGFTYAEAFLFACECDNAMQAGLVHRYGKRAVDVRYDRQATAEGPDYVRWGAQAKLLADEAMAALVPWRRAGSPLAAVRRTA